MKRLMIGFVAIVGALMCVPAFIGCSDGVMEEVEDPNLPEDPVGPDQGHNGLDTIAYKSWFDLPEEERMRLWWMLGDDVTVRGPGEYEFNVPAEGEEFTFWFPTCNQIIRWAEFDGVVHSNDVDWNCIPLDFIRHGVKFDVQEPNCIRLTIEPDAYAMPHKYVVCVHDFQGDGIVRLTFNQDAGEVRTGSVEEEKYLYWKSDSHRLFYFTSNNGTPLSMYVPSHGGSFGLKCLNGGNLRISDSNLKPEEVTGELVEKNGIRVKAKNDSILFEIPRNATGKKNGVGLWVSDGKRKSKILVYQMFEGYKYDREVSHYYPEWELVNDGTRWTGGIAGHPMKVSPMGDTLSIKSLNYEVVFAEHLTVDDKTYRRTGNTIVLGWSSWDFPVLEGAAGVRHHNSRDGIDCVFAPNLTGLERVVRVTVEYSGPFFVGMSSTPFFAALNAHHQFIFVQPPYPGRKSGAEGDGA